MSAFQAFAMWVIFAVVIYLVLIFFLCEDYADKEYRKFLDGPRGGDK